MSFLNFVLVRIGNFDFRCNERRFYFILDSDSDAICVDVYVILYMLGKGDLGENYIPKLQVWVDFFPLTIILV